MKSACESRHSERNRHKHEIEGIIIFFCYRRLESLGNVYLYSRRIQLGIVRSSLPNRMGGIYNSQAERHSKINKKARNEKKKAMGCPKSP